MAFIPTLRSLGFLIKFPTSLLTSFDGSVIEIFEWKSKSVSEEAHENPKVKDVWGQMESLAVAATPLGSLQKPKRHLPILKKCPHSLGVEGYWPVSTWDCEMWRVLVRVRVRP